MRSACLPCAVREVYKRPFSAGSVLLSSSTLLVSFLQNFCGTARWAVSSSFPPKRLTYWLMFCLDSSVFKTYILRSHGSFCWVEKHLRFWNDSDFAASSVYQTNHPSTWWEDKTNAFLKWTPVFPMGISSSTPLSLSWEQLFGLPLFSNLPSWYPHIKHVPGTSIFFFCNLLRPEEHQNLIMKMPMFFPEMAFIPKQNQELLDARRISRSPNFWILYLLSLRETYQKEILN